MNLESMATPSTQQRKLGKLQLLPIRKGGGGRAVPKGSHRPQSSHSPSWPGQLPFHVVRLCHGIMVPSDTSLP